MNIVITHAKRSPITNFLGGLSSLSAQEIMVPLLKTITVPPEEISEVILGQVLVGGQGQNPPRQASVNAGFPHTLPAWGVSHVCGSGLKSIALAAQSIIAGDNKSVIAGGMESMSQARHATFVRPGIKMGDASLVDMMILDGLWDSFNGYHMGITAENVAKKYAISREQQDEYAYNSQQKVSSALSVGRFKDEIVAITVRHRKKEVIVDSDEFIKPETSLESLATLRPVFDKEGSVTAGNASGLNDGAAMLLVMSEEEAVKQGLEPLARIVSFGQDGVDPSIMGIGPVGAVEKALDKAGWSVDDLDLIEANEAFAAQAIAVNNAIGWDVEKVNVNGGAIALGHPIGASGARIVVTLLHEMQRRDVKRGLATLCIGGGMGVAMCFER